MDWREPIIHRWTIWIIGILVILSFPFIFLYQSVSRFDSSFIPEENRDAAIILGFSIKDGQLSPGLKERVDHGLALYQKGIVSHLIVAGGVGQGEDQSEAEVMKQYLIHKGVPSQKIIMETTSRNTKENLYHTAQILEQNQIPWQTFYLVTHGFHIHRALLYANQAGLSMEPAPSSDQSLFLPYHKLRECLAIIKFYLLDQEKGG